MCFMYAFLITSNNTQVINSGFQIYAFLRLVKHKFSLDSFKIHNVNFVLRFLFVNRKLSSSSFSCPSLHFLTGVLRFLLLNNVSEPFLQLTMCFKKCPCAFKSTNSSCLLASSTSRYLSISFCSSSQFWFFFCNSATLNVLNNKFIPFLLESLLVFLFSSSLNLFRTSEDLRDCLNAML